jgi:hypothetical protein
MDQGRDATERMQGEVRRRDVGGERVDLDPIVGDPLLRQGQAGDAIVDAVAVAMQDERHAAILAFH